MITFASVSNDYFQFKQFTVRQQQCAMKVGTDGCLLGAWANCPKSNSHSPSILDIGTGTGLISLMMAQRFPEAKVTALDISHEAVIQACENVAASPFANRIKVLEEDIANYIPNMERNSLDHSGHFEAIVSNPPYYIDSLACPDEQRTIARHAGSMTYEMLMQKSAILLDIDGELSVIVPSEFKQQMEQAAAMSGLSLARLCAVKTTVGKPPRRYLLAFRKQSVSVVSNTEIVIGDLEYNALLRDFYLKM